MQGCRAGTGAAAAAPVPAVGTKLSQRSGTIYSEPKSESDINPRLTGGGGGVSRPPPSRIFAIGLKRTALST